jgi:autotransporter-associated beta strand protein
MLGRIDQHAAFPVRGRARMLPVAAGAAVALGSLTSAALGQTYTWIGGAPGGNFSDNTKWLNGSGPGTGTGSDTTALVFNTINAAAITASNNNGTPFVVNSLTFNVNDPFTLNSTTSAWQYQFAGTSPFISMNGLGIVSTFTTGGNIALAADTTIGGNGPGNLSLSGVISEIGGSHALTISGGPSPRALRMVSLGGANTFTGGLTIDGGTVNASGGIQTAFGAAGGTVTVTSNGGSIGIAQTFTSSLGTLQLNGDVHFIGGGGLTLGGSGGVATVVQGSGRLCESFATGGLTINGDCGSTAASPYTGAVIIDQSELPNMGTALVGSLTLGAQAGQSTTLNGSLNAVPSFDVRAGGLLLLNNNVTDSVQNGDRIGDSTPVNLRSGSILLNGPAPSGTHSYTPASLSEKIGTLSCAGSCTVTVAPTTGTTVSTTLEADSLVRVERGTINIRGTALGDGTSALRGRVILTHPLASSEFVGGGGAAASQNISILPYAVGGTGTGDFGTTLVTYDTDGFRPLSTGEYYGADLAPADSTANVRLAPTVSPGQVANNASTTMNALVLANNGTTVDASVTGTGTLNITSGAIIANPRNAMTSISNNIAFGAAEGVISTPGFNGLKITGNLTGSNGLTKTNNGQTTGNNILVLTGDNSGLTGTLTLDGGVVQFSSDLALPGTGAIVCNGSYINTTGPALGLFYVGGPALTISRNISVNTGYLTIKQFDATGTQPSIGMLTVAGQISGAGSVCYQAQNPSITNAGAIWVTNTGNTYTGATRFSTGFVHIAGDGCTGAGGGWSFGGAGTLVLEGDVTNSRHINFEAGATATINTNGHNMTLNGPITCLPLASLNPGTSTGGFNKNGAGTLTLTNPTNLLPGAISVLAGSLIVNGSFGPSAANAITVASGATLGGSGTLYRNITINAGGMLSPGNSPGTMSTGNVALNGTLAADVNGTSAADLLNVTGTVTLGATSALNLAVTGTPSGPVIIVQNDGTDAVTGTFATVTGLPAGVTISYAFSGTDSLGRVGDGNDIAVIFPVAPPPCYANCDGSTQAPILNVADFTCFLQKYAGGDSYANCDASTQPPVLNVADFTCFLQKYAAGCP